MIKPQTPTEQLMYATIRFEATTAKGGQAVGTAFFFNHRLDDTHEVPLIITNKHVVKDAAVGRFLVHLQDQNAQDALPSDQSTAIELANCERQFFMHPDPDVDLCLIPYQPLVESARQQGYGQLYRVALSSSLIPTQAQLEELSTVENVLMVGYPNGLWDQANNLPLFRRGITASHPAIDYNGKSIMVIDAACFPGSSGSPVILYDQGMRMDKKGNSIIGGYNLLFLGVLHAGPQVTARGDITVVDIPTAQVPVAVTQMMMNLGYVVKAKEVATLCDAFVADLRAQGRLP